MTIIIEIATATIDTQVGTAIGALTGIEIGIGEIAIAVTGTVTDSRAATLDVRCAAEVKYKL